MLQQIRRTIVKKLWQNYRQNMPQIHLLETKLPAFVLDHFAIIDLPGYHTGIAQLAQIFSALGFVVRGQGYLADKQNEFWWLAETNCEDQLAVEALPQVVIADFHLDEMPLEIKKIIEKYVAMAPKSPLLEMQRLITQQAEQPLCELIINYFSGRDWPLPTMAEFKTVQAFNELLAWVLVFGRKPNHFTLAVHLLPNVKNLDEFNQFLVNDLKWVLNEQGNVIKGGAEVGIAQSATVGELVQVKLADGVITLPDSFIEFVWRYPKNKSAQKPLVWNAYFTGFVVENANDVIESLYV